MPFFELKISKADIILKNLATQLWMESNLKVQRIVNVKFKKNTIQLFLHASRILLLLRNYTILHMGRTLLLALLHVFFFFSESLMQQTDVYSAMIVLTHIADINICIKQTRKKISPPPPRNDSRKLPAAQRVLQ